MRLPFDSHRLRRRQSPIQLLAILMLLLQPIGLGGTPADASNPAVNPPQPNTPTDTPIPIFSSETYNEWTINSGLVYWAERCLGGELLNPATLKRMPTGGGVPRLLATTGTTDCVTYEDMVADSDGLYYYDNSDSRIETRSSSIPALATTVYTLTAGLAPVGERLAVSGNYVYWLTTDNRLVRASKDGAAFDVVVSTISTGADLVGRGRKCVLAR